MTFDFDNEFSQATELGTINNSTVRTGRIGDVDINGSQDIFDVYKFTVSRESEYKISLTGMSGLSNNNTDLELYDISKSRIGLSSNTPVQNPSITGAIVDNRNEEIKSKLKPGAYYISVWARSNSPAFPSSGHNYTLNVATTQPNSSSSNSERGNVTKPPSKPARPLPR